MIVGFEAMKVGGGKAMATAKPRNFVGRSSAAPLRNHLMRCGLRLGIVAVEGLPFWRMAVPG
jgi:hypothetical protein